MYGIMFTRTLHTSTAEYSSATVDNNHQLLSSDVEILSDIIMTQLPSEAVGCWFELAPPHWDTRVLD
jgi:hypothetical protein